MPALYRDNLLSAEDHTLLPKSEKYVSFDPEPQYREIQDIRTKQKKRVTRRLHIFGFFSLILGLLFYFRTCMQFGHHGHHPDMTESTPNHKSASFAFDNVDQFSLSEILDNQGYTFLDIRGTIVLTSSDTFQDAAIVANVSMTSYNIEIESTKFDTTPTSLIIGNPDLKNRSYFRRPCITIDVSVHVKPGVKFSTFSIDTRHLHIEVDPSLDLAVSDTTTLATVSGHVNSPTAPAKFTSRRKYIRSVSGGIRGSYALEDVLSCATASGGISIFVVPKKAGKVVAPAEFSARSGSGHCDVQFETLGAPERDYTVDVHSGSGGARGTYIHGSRTRIESGSGSKRIDIVPYDGSGGELTTQGGSGSTDVNVRSPLKESKTLGPLRSTHRSVSGSLRLNYPREWAGTFEGTSVSGSLVAEGRGLVVDGGRGQPGLKRLTGRSVLDGKAELSFSSVSGGARLLVV